MLLGKEAVLIIPEGSQSRALHVRARSLDDAEEGAHGFPRHWLDDDHFLSGAMRHFGSALPGGFEVVNISRVRDHGFMTVCL